MTAVKTSISDVKMWPDGGYRVFAVIRCKEAEYDSPEKDTLEVYIDGNKIRYYPMDSLPDCLRSQLAMIHTHDWDQYGDDLSHYVCLDFPRGLYPEQYEGIGWMVDYYDDRRVTHYVLVLEEKDLKKLHE